MNFEHSEERGVVKPKARVRACVHVDLVLHSPQLDSQLQLQLITASQLFSMRRGPGLAALSRTAQSSSSYATLGNDLSSASLAELRVQLDSFTAALRTFAARHRSDIQRDASFRHSFQQMCSALGVDPLVSGAPSMGRGTGVGAQAKGALWQALGLGDWTYALGVQVVDVCVSTRALNGGLIDVQDLCEAVMRLRSGAAPSLKNRKSDPANVVTPDDVKRALATLKPLGCGYELVKLGGRSFVRTLPNALDPSTTVLLSLLSSPSSNVPRDEHTGLPYLTLDALVPPEPALGKPERWTYERARVALDNATRDEGLLWIDEGVHPARYYSLATAGTDALGALSA